MDHPEQSVRLQAVEILAGRTEIEINNAFGNEISQQSPSIRAALITAMLRTPARAQLLLDAVEAGRVPPREIDPARADQLRKHPDSAIRERAQALLVDTTAADRQKVITDYQPALTLESDPDRGRALFVKNCQQCHKIGDIGVNVAPDISDSRTKTHEQLLVSILDPNRAIDNNYFSYTVLDTDGVVYTGVIAAETATSVTLKQAEGKEITLLRSDVDEIRNNGVSLMPVGLEKDLDLQQMADLISFIKNWRYLDGSVPSQVIR
jgi:putative heme-binding domain-containing protein